MDPMDTACLETLNDLLTNSAELDKTPEGSTIFANVLQLIFAEYSSYYLIYCTFLISWVIYESVSRCFKSRLMTRRWTSMTLKFQLYSQEVKIIWRDDQKASNTHYLYQRRLNIADRKDTISPTLHFYSEIKKIYKVWKQNHNTRWSSRIALNPIVQRQIKPALTVQARVRLWLPF